MQIFTVLLVVCKLSLAANKEQGTIQESVSRVHLSVQINWEAAKEFPLDHFFSRA